MEKDNEWKTRYSRYVEFEVDGELVEIAYDLPLLSGMPGYYQFRHRKSLSRRTTIHGNGLREADIRSKVRRGIASGK